MNTLEKLQEVLIKQNNTFFEKPNEFLEDVQLALSIINNDEVNALFKILEEKVNLIMFQKKVKDLNVQEDYEFIFSKSSEANIAVKSAYLHSIGTH